MELAALKNRIENLATQTEFSEEDRSVFEEFKAARRGLLIAGVDVGAKQAAMRRRGRHVAPDGICSRTGLLHPELIIQRQNAGMAAIPVITPERPRLDC